MRMQQLRHTGDPSDSYETLSDDRATLSTSSADPKSNDESTNVDDDEGSTPQRFERRRLSMVASEHAPTAARRASAAEAKKHQSLFIRLQPFASEQNRFIACVVSFVFHLFFSVCWNLQFKIRGLACSAICVDFSACIMGNTIRCHMGRTFRPTLFASSKSLCGFYRKNQKPKIETKTIVYI